MKTPKEKIVVSIEKNGVVVNYIKLQSNHACRIKEVLFNQIFHPYHTEMDFTNAIQNGWKVLTELNKTKPK